MKPTNIILVRHGESEGNVNQDIYTTVPDYALNLTPKGMQQAVDAGKAIRAICGDSDVKFYVSPFYRTRQTFQGIAASFVDATCYEDPRLREQEWSGKLSPYGREMDVEREKYGHFYYRFSGGESCADVYDRVSDFMNTMHRDFEKPTFPRNCVIVNHGMTMRVFLMRWFHATVEEFESWGNPANCQLVVLKKQWNEKYMLTAPLRQHEIRNVNKFNPQLMIDFINSQKKEEANAS